MMRLAACSVLAVWALVPARQDVFRSGVEVVEVDVSVTRGNVAVAGLTARDFAVTDNGAPQEVTSATLGEVPLRVQMVLDASGSVAGERLVNLVKAGQALVDRLKPDDQAALITFSQQARLLVPMGRELAALRLELAGLTGSGATALRDAVYLAMLTPSDAHARSLLLLFSDGLDTASWQTGDAALAAARRANTVVHVVRAGRDGFLDRLADATGGRTWSAGSDRQLEELFTRALDEMRARYVLTYSPTGPRTPGWHDIKVSLRRQRADITARPGYFVQ